MPFDERFLRTLEALDLMARRVVSGDERAERRAPRKGASVEFADYRRYVPGDEVRYIDWNVYARHGSLFVKEFSAEENVHVSPLLAASHPSVEQVYRESIRLHRNLERLAGPRRTGPAPPEPTLEEIRERRHDEPVDREREVRELVGRCLWDVFSDNHDVIAADGREVHLGSFRGAGDFIADLLNGEVGSRQYDYMDLFMGTI